MKTKEELTEAAGLVRDVIARTRIDFPADDHERDLTDALYRKAYAELANLEATHIRRLHEALCEAKFLSATGHGLRRGVSEQLARHHNLRNYRTVKMPLITPAAQPGK